MSRNTHDIVIVGAGLAGLIQARLLTEAGFKVLVLEPRSEPAKDARATALTSGSAQTLGLSETWLENHAQPVSEMIVDGGAGSSIDLENALSFGGSASDRTWIVQNADLMDWLTGQEVGTVQRGARVVASQAEDGIRKLLLENGVEVAARLVIAADGKRSGLRRMADIQSHVQDFNQLALTGIIRHSEGHAGRAWQRFLPGGTLAFLPLPGADGLTSSFIWVEPKRLGKDLFDLSPSILAERLQARFGEALGTLSPPENAKWQSFPLVAHHCDEVIADRLALIGEAAHSVHPLAGQGLNLSIRDAAALRDALVAQRRLGMDLGDEAPLLDYQRARRPDVARMMALTNGLHALFDEAPGPVRALAGFGLSTLNRIAPLKKLLETEANR